MQRHVLTSLATAFALAISTPLAMAHPGDDEDETQVQDVRADVVVSVDGMHCVECAGTIGARLQSTGPVEAFAADIDAGTLTVAIPEGESLDDETIADAVRWAGYTVIDITRNS